MDRDLEDMKTTEDYRIGDNSTIPIIIRKIKINSFRIQLFKFY
jgi:hypothetical protein